MPSLLLTPADARNADGPVPVDASGIVDVVDGAWWLARGIGAASLLLSPDGSYDAAGPVEPTVSGDVPVVAGQYGQAWNLSALDSRLTVSLAAYDLAADGTVLIRARMQPPVSGASSFAYLALISAESGGSANRIDLLVHPTLVRLASPASGGGRISVDMARTEQHATPSVIGARWGEWGLHSVEDGVFSSSAGSPATLARSSLAIGGGTQYTARAHVESVVLYDTSLLSSEIARLSTMDRAWTWGPDGTLSAPLATAPASILLRTRSGETVTTHHIAGASGEAGGATVTHADGTLTIGTTDEVEVVGVLAFAEALSSFDIERYSRMVWAWENFLTPPAPDLSPPSTPSPMATYQTGSVYQTPAALITIDGVPTPCTIWRSHHGVDQPVGSATLTIPLSAIDHVSYNGVVEITSGYRESSTHRNFLGRIVEIERTFGPDGASLRVFCEGDGRLLRWKTRTPLTYPGPVRLAALYRSLVQLSHIDRFRADAVLFPTTATHVAFGGVPEIDGGDVVIPQGTVPQSWLSQKAGLFGYRVFDAPGGENRLQRISGLASGPVVATFAEGVDIFRVGNRGDTRPIVTDWTVNGASYTDADGVPIEIRSIPGMVPPAPEIMPPGYRSDSETDAILSTQALVDAVRNVREIDHSAPYEVVTWTTYGRPDIQPGDTIGIISASTGLPDLATRWVMDIQHQWGDRGFTTTLTAWAGAGQPLDPGIDETIIPIGSGVYRLGDEYLPHYVHPNPGGESVTIPFNVPGTYTSLALRVRLHGSNSYLIDGANADSTVSKLEVWQGGERLATADLPMAPEDLHLRRDYRDDRWWVDARMPIPGQIEPGVAELKVVAGKDSRAAPGFQIDDFEAKNFAIEARGTGFAILPGVS